MCDKQKLPWLSWMDGLCSPQFPMCSQNAVFRSPFIKKTNVMVHHLGGLLSKRTFHWLLRIKEKSQIMTTGTSTMRCLTSEWYLWTCSCQHVLPVILLKMQRSFNKSALCMTSVGSVFRNLFLERFSNLFGLKLVYYHTKSHKQIVFPLPRSNGINYAFGLGFPNGRRVQDPACDCSEHVYVHTIYKYVTQ